MPSEDYTTRLPFPAFKVRSLFLGKVCLSGVYSKCLCLLAHSFLFLLHEQVGEDKWAASGFVCMTSEWATSLTAWYRNSLCYLYIETHSSCHHILQLWQLFTCYFTEFWEHADVATDRKHHPDRSIANNPLFIQENVVCKLSGCFVVVGLGYNQPVVFIFCPIVLYLRLLLHVVVSLFSQCYYYGKARRQKQWK